MTPGNTVEVDALNEAMKDSGTNAHISGQMPESHRGGTVSQAMEDLTSEAEQSTNPPPSEPV